MFADVVKFARQIKDEKLDKVIYIKNNKTSLINKNQLPQTYYQKSNILFVDDPTAYLKEANNKNPTQQELSQFKLIGEDINNEEVYLPEELWEIIIMKKPINEIVKMRSLSKEWKRRIDKLWCKLLKRDFDMDKDKNCKKVYEKTYTNKQIFDPINKILKTIHPNLTFDSGVELYLSEIIGNLVGILIKKAEELMIQGKTKSITAKHMEYATMLVLKGELMKHAKSEANKALTYYSEKSKGNILSQGELSLPDKIVPNINRESKIYLLAVVEYLLVEVLELGGNAAKDDGRDVIEIKDIQKAIRGDEELYPLFNKLYFNF